jgi:hypothetical protein
MRLLLRLDRACLLQSPTSMEIFVLILPVLKPGPITPAQRIIGFSCNFRRSDASLSGSSEPRAASGLKRAM